MKIDLLQLTDIGDYCKKVAQVQDLAVVEYAGGKYLLGERQNLKLTPPINSSNDSFFLGKKRQHFNFNYSFTEKHLSVFPNCQLVGNAVLLTHDNQIIKSSFSNAEILQKTGHFLQKNLKLNLGNGLQEIPFVLFRNSPQSVKKIEEPAILITNYWQFNYHHWIIDLLPRLQIALEIPEFNHYKIVLPKTLNPFQKKSIELLNIPDERILFFDESHWQFRRLYFPDIGIFRRSELTWVKSQFYQSLNIEKSNPTKKYYITRQDATTRRLVNEASIMKVLERFGFEMLNLSQMDWSEQIRHFSLAKTIIGPHGAGLTNILFSSTSTKLIELMPNDAPNQCFWLQAAVMGQSYVYIVGQKINEQRDFKININELEKLLKEI